MQTKRFSDTFTVSGQLTEADLPALQAAGVRHIICNRPDNEAPDQPSYAELVKAASALGMQMHYLPVVYDNINSAQVRAFGKLLESSEGPVHAWCRSGLRSAALWSLVQAQHGTPTDPLVQAGNANGFDFSKFPARFAGVMEELRDSFAALPVAAHCPMLIVGAGSGGISLAASILRRDPRARITLVDPADTHYYQPGFTMVGGGIFSLDSTRRPMASVVPSAATWVQAAVMHFLPEQNQVVLDNGTRLSYDRLVVCAGLKLNWDAVEGLSATLGQNGVTSNYRADLSEYTWQLVKELQGGKAVFTQPPMPIKCAGAPQKVLYLSADYWRSQQRLDKFQIDFYLQGGALFGVKEYVPALQSYMDKYHATTHYGQNLVKVDGPAHIATFSSPGADGTPVLTDVPFDLLHVTPPQCAPDFVRNSPLADLGGWIDVDPATLKHRRYPNVWALGDVTNTPNAKTAAAVRKQVPVVANNLLNDLHGDATTYDYLGYGACPLTVERGRIVLAEFGYGGKLQPTFPRWLLEGTRPTWQAWFLKASLLPWLYWNLMLKGHEPLAAPPRSK
ncbi:MAG TPA: TIGR01244 family sulfur transferase [Hyphomicrobiales bacterium]|nr:TIGR01244 family sulfur transferase [Hyphomicrobiales bacterium]